ncbi:hypothetical protein M413DRAFT_14175 [Hebeloma cylindrosporum]|uniref:HNH nuclease domain-containing protein n=1 Tax=Hebeloma cylindrosporum TaxID=76867 RepID=A0A0C2Y4U7_HEBCY|nr:hypothetical protein M413DRAFT_14175 [Hebeloma cylindrosporum h7]
MPAIVVPAGHVALVLLEEGASSFYLEIPMDKIISLCLKPRKYLLFLGTCVLGVPGRLARVRGGPRINTDEVDLDERGIYYYVAAGGIVPAAAIDPDVIKVTTNSEVSSEPGTCSPSFRNQLEERDFGCLWSALRGEFVQGSEWFRLIVESRPCHDEDVKTLDDVDDVRNGFLGNHLLYSVFEPREVVVLKTPNRILTTDDVPPRHHRALSENVEYPPDGSRFTLQWLVDPGKAVMETNTAPNNCDAAFRKCTIGTGSAVKPKPSDLLLHYNYGAAVVKNWGKNIDVLRKCTEPPRPSNLVVGPSETKHRCGTTTRKRAPARSSGGDRDGRPTADTGMLAESEGEPEWDEDDVMLFFLVNTPAARERFRKQDEENTQRMERWREDVPQGPV